jgi:hypothetical protein
MKSRPDLKIKRLKPISHILRKCYLKEVILVTLMKKKMMKMKLIMLSLE